MIVLRGPKLGHCLTSMCTLRVAVISLIVATTSCGGVQKLDPRIPTDIPGQLVLYRTPHIDVDDTGITITTRSILMGRKVTTAAALRKALVRMPVTDWFYGRHLGVGLPGPGCCSATAANIAA